MVKIHNKAFALFRNFGTEYELSFSGTKLAPKMLTRIRFMI